MDVIKIQQKVTRVTGGRPEGIFYEECGPFPTAPQSVKDNYLKEFEDSKPIVIYTIESEFNKKCREGLQKALEDKDGWLAHYYGSMLVDSSPIRNPRPNRATQIWVD